MFGFHRRQRSLIPVKELSKYDVKYEKLDMDMGMEMEDDFEEVVLDEPSKPKSKQLTLIYIIFLAEAYEHTRSSFQKRRLIFQFQNRGSQSSTPTRHAALIR